MFSYVIRVLQNDFKNEAVGKNALIDSGQYINL